MRFIYLLAAAAAAVGFCPFKSVIKIGSDTRVQRTLLFESWYQVRIRPSLDYETWKRVTEYNGSVMG